MLRPHSDLTLRGPFKHTNCRQYKQFVEPFVLSKPGGDQVETIAIFRDPIDQVYSWFRYRSRPSLADETSEARDRSTAGLSFSDFVEAYLQPEPPEFAKFPRQYQFVRDADGNVGVDRVFPFDDLDRFVDYMSSLVGTELKLPHQNESPRQGEDKDWSCLLSQGLLDGLHQKLRKDIEFYQSLQKTADSGK